MRPTPGAYIALVRAANGLLCGGQTPSDLSRHPGLAGYRRVRFTEPDGEVSPTPSDWIENLQEFRARRLSLVLFRVVDPDPHEHIVVETDPSGVWGLQVTYERRVHLWLAGADGGTLDFQGQPVSPSLSDGPPIEEAAGMLLDTCLRGRALAPDPTAPTPRSLGRVVDLLRGAPLPESAYFGPGIPQAARRLGIAGQAAWRFCSRSTRAAAVRELADDPGRIEELAAQLHVTVAGALVAATNGALPL